MGGEDTKRRVHGVFESEKNQSTSVVAQASDAFQVLHRISDNLYRLINAIMSKSVDN